MSHVSSLVSVVDAFPSAGDFLTSGSLDRTDCLILDIAMPGMPGPQLQDELAARGAAIPIVYITALADPNIRQRMRLRGAIECLFKPFSPPDLIDAVNAALRRG
jgi:FixJ family two-component response regulator